MADAPVLDAVYWAKSAYLWAHPRPPKPIGIKIYEASHADIACGTCVMAVQVHIGISSQEPKIASYVHFRDNVLPRIHALVMHCPQPADSE